MLTLREMNKKLRKAEKKRSLLYLFCNFMALLLITAYAAMMYSPTVLTVLPAGGDSRKQMIAIFVLACFGCVVFALYASNLFFRHKSKQLGTLMALGASKKTLSPGFLGETLTISALSSACGIVCGLPFAWCLWQCFRLFLVDSAEMELTFDFRCYIVPLVFFLVVILLTLWLAVRYLRRMNVMDIVHAEHKNEPVRELGRWCGPVGIVCLLFGAVVGYSAGGVYMNLFSKYPPFWLNFLYAPVFVGLYMIMLHTVVHGWTSHKKKPYKNIISKSMMKFQGKQTVNHLIVVTVLIAGACFAIFYLPMMAVGQFMEVKSRPYDYAYFYRSDQDVPDQNEIEALASRYGLAAKDWQTAPYSSLALDGQQEIDEADGSFHYVYRETLIEAKCISESSYASLTGQKIDVVPGSYWAISNATETGTYFINSNATLLTNMVTRQQLNTAFAGYLHYDMLMDDNPYYVLDDTDYGKITAGLTPDWQGSQCFFNIDGTDSYAFADAFFHVFVNSFDEDCETINGYDRVAKIDANEQGQTYWGDTDKISKISFAQPDSSDFRLNWTYMPKFRILDQNDFLRSFAVYLMMFLFISIICLLAALIISYTRCMTITLNNRYVFDDLKRLGASPLFLSGEVKSQAGKVFKIPAFVGMGLMYLLYTMIMFANDGKFTMEEGVGLLVCLGVLLLVGAVIFAVYRLTVKKMKQQLEI